MSSLNPDFRGADEVEVPSDLSDMLGWAEDLDDLKDALNREDVMRGQFEADMPFACQQRPARAMNQEMLKKWNDFQKSKGRYEGSYDWSLLDEFVHGKPLVYRPQIIGSCVISNTFPGIVERHMYETVLLGQPQEYLGRDEFGPNSYAPYAAWSYGMARRRANMRGGDGLYCAPMAESLVKDGVLPCNTPALLTLLKSKGLDREQDFPEPQNANFYRALGRWQYLDDLKPHAKYAFVEAPSVTSADQLWDCLSQGKTAFVCSGEAIHKVGQHPDGFAIHARNPRDSWAHNMRFNGALVASDGERFIRQSNQSWGERHQYTRRFSEVDQAFRARRLRVAALGETNGPESSPPLIGT